MKKLLVLVSLLFSLALVTPALAQTSTTPHLDANGWTVFTPSADTRTIYVSSSQGSDSNDGLSPNTPVQTLAHASSLLRKGYPDWLLLKKGDVWTGDVGNNGLFGNNGFVGWQGRSASEPMLISSYGTGARPVIQAWTSNTDGSSVIASSPSSAFYGIDNVAIVGIDFYAYKRDTTNANYDAKQALVPISAITLVNSPNWILIEDCKMQFLGIDAEATTQAGAGTLQLRRNVIVDSFSMGGIIEDYTNVLLEENIFDHNGWSETSAINSNGTIEPAGFRNVFTHNIYGQYDATGNVPNQQWTYRGNISTRGSDTGLRSRQGGVMDNNLLAQDGWGFDYGGYTSVTTNAVTNNVILQGVNINGSFVPVGISDGTDSTGANRPTLLSGNIIAHVTDTSALSFGTAGITLSAGSHNVTATKNIVVDGWGTNGYSALHDYGTNNTVAADNITAVGSNLTAAAATYGWSDPYRTIETYDRNILGGPGTFADFIARARNQSKDTWNPALTAEAVNDYIRGGFGVAAIGYPYAGGTIVTPTPTPTPTPAPNPVATTTTPTSTPPTPTPAPSTYKYPIGSRVKTTAKVNVRIGAAATGKPLGQQKTGSLGTVLQGPTTNGGYNWLKINFDSGADGWVADAYLTASLAATLQSVQVVQIQSKIDQLLAEIDQLKADLEAAVEAAQ